MLPSTNPLKGTLLWWFTSTYNLWLGTIPRQSKTTQEHSIFCWALYLTTIPWQSRTILRTDVPVLHKKSFPKIWRLKNLQCLKNMPSKSGESPITHRIPMTMTIPLCAYLYATIYIHMFIYIYIYTEYIYRYTEYMYVYIYIHNIYIYTYIYNTIYTCVCYMHICDIPFVTTAPLRRTPSPLCRRSKPSSSPGAVEVMGENADVTLW